MKGQAKGSSSRKRGATAAPSKTTSENNNTAEADKKSDGAVGQKPVKKEEAPAWSEKYQVSLDLNARYDIPQTKTSIVPKEMTLEQADECFEKKCDWITLR